MIFFKSQNPKKNREIFLITKSRKNCEYFKSQNLEKVAKFYQQQISKSIPDFFFKSQNPKKS